MDEMIEADVPLEPIGTAERCEEHAAACSSKICVPWRSNICLAICRILLRWRYLTLNIGDAIHVREIQLPAGVTTRSSAGSDGILGPRCRQSRKSQLR